MPELPEVEHAARIARRVAHHRRITSVEVLHPALRRSLGRRDAASLAGERVERVHRRGKLQIFRLTSGRDLVVHFRMTGDWEVVVPDAPLPRFARAVIRFDSAKALVLDDPRALSVLSLGALPELGPEPLGPGFTPRVLAGRLAARSAPIKPVLLDQRVVAGLGNIYVAEVLWRARIDPRAPARGLGAASIARLTAAIRGVLRDALRRVRRYSEVRGSRRSPFAVYDREGKPCRRCGTRIARIVQAQRSTYYCPHCQR